MGKTEAELRREAVRRRLAGESPEAIARSLGRSRRRVSKCVARHEAGGEDWAAGARRGPGRAPHRAPAEPEALVPAVRERLVANPWAQVGAEAIAWELERLGVTPPATRPLERIVARAGATRRRAGRRRHARGTPYPAAPADRPGDLAAHRCGIEIVESDADERVAQALVFVWDRLGPAVRLQLDGGGPFVAPKGLGLIVRLCLHQGRV